MNTYLKEKQEFRSEFESECKADDKVHAILLMSRKSGKKRVLEQKKGYK